MRQNKTKNGGTRFGRLFSTAVSGLRDYYPELNDAKAVAQIKEAVGPAETANNQLDYESIRDQIEREIRHRRTQGAR